MEQVWFSGAHTDVGGGFEEAGLSDITLEWMVQKAVAHGIKLYLRSIEYWNFCIAPDATDIVHPPRVGGGKIYPAQERTWPQAAEETFGKPVIHQSVLDRAQRFGDYQPWILKKFPDHVVEPWTIAFEYENEQISIRDYDEESSSYQFEFKEKKVRLLKQENKFDNLIKRSKWSGNRLRRDLKRWQKGDL